MAKENAQTGSNGQKDNSISNNRSLQHRFLEEHLWMHNMWNIEADGLQPPVS